MLAVALIAGLAGLFLLFSLLGRAPEASGADRPNFVVIQTDDQSPRLMRSKFRGDRGGFQRTMPNTMDMVVRGGTEFPKFYATSPVCSPSRASLLTGQYPHSNGLISNGGPFGGWQGWMNLPTATRNLPVSLQRAGYRTSHFGKFTNSYYDPVTGGATLEVPPGFDNWFTNSFRSGDNRMYGYSVNDNGQIKGPYGKRNYSDKRGLDPRACRIGTGSVHIGGKKKRCNYITDVMTRRAVDEIRNGGDGPLFLQIDYDAPHGDVRPPAGPQPATRHLGSASRTPMPRPPNFNEADFSDKPAALREVAPRRLGPREIKRTVFSYRKQIESLRSIDDSVGAIIGALRKTGELDNTYVFFLSDHGYFIGEHRFSLGKFLAYEEASTVSMAVRGPGIRRGVKSREIVGNIDVPATIFGLSDAEPDYSVDGRSMAPYWKRPGLTTRRPIEISLLGSSGAAGDGSASTSGAVASARAPALDYRGYRVGPYKLIKYESGESELYDLKRDRSELENVFRDGSYAPVREYMEEHLDQVINCSGSGCREQLPPWPRPLGR